MACWRPRTFQNPKPRQYSQNNALVVLTEDADTNRAYGGVLLSVRSVKPSGIAPNEPSMTKTAIVIVFAAAYLLHTPGIFAQAAQQTAVSSNSIPTILSDKEINLMRSDIRSQKKQLIAANLKLTDAEATKFWPIYDQYTQEQTKINDQKFALIEQYARNWGNMTDGQAAGYTRQWLSLDEATASLRSKYAPIVQGVLPGVKAASFFQMDRRLSMMIDLQLSSQIPIAQDQ